MTARERLLVFISLNALGVALLMFLLVK
jgi:hypothetical protein